MQISIANAIQVARRIGSAASIITNGLKMWLGFQTSETLGRELVVNGDFATDLSGWSFAGTDATNTITWNNGRVEMIADGTTALKLEQTIFDVGKVYEIELDAYNITGDGFKVYDNGTVLVIQSDKHYKFYHTAISTSLTIYRNSGGLASSGEFDNISVKELTQITPDLSGNSNVGQLFTGKALDFNGSGDSVDCGDVGANKTLAFWFNPTTDITSSTGPQRLFGFNTDFHGVSLGSVAGDLTDETLTIVPDASSRTATTMNFDAGVWYRVVVIWNATNSYYDIYVNGELKTDLVFGTHTLIDWSNFLMGEVPAGTGSNFDGKLSNVQIYNAVWSADDIAYDYAKPNHLVTDNPSTSLTVTNLKAYWALSEGAGLVAYDSGTNLEADLILDGNFPLPNTNWTLRNAWTVSDNKASLLSTSSQSYLSQADVFTANTIKTYQLKFDAVVESGRVIVQNNDGSFLTITEVSTTANNITVVFQTTSTETGTLYFKPASVLGVGFQGSITNVSVREVTPSDHGGLVIGATYTENEPRIPQLGMVDWAIGSNLYLNSEPTSNEGVAGNITYGSYSWGLNGFSNATIYGDSSVTRYRYGATVLQNTEYTLSCYVIMDDLTEPNVGNNTASGDFCIIIGGAQTTLNATSVNVSGDIWRISRTITTGTTNLASNGITKYSSQSDKGFKVVGWQIEQSATVGNYILTDRAAAIDVTTIQNPSNKGYDIFGNSLRLREHAFNLDGSGYAEVADSDSLDINTAITLECWLYQREIGYSTIVRKRDGSNGFAWYVGNSVVKQRVFIGSIGAKNSDSYAPINQWNHLAVSYNGSTIQFYLNGVPNGSSDAIGNIGINASVLTVGVDGLNSTKLDELLDEPRIYNRALSEDEILNNYNVGLPAHTNPSSYSGDYSSDYGF